MHFSTEAVLNVVSHLPVGKQESLDIPGVHELGKFSVEVVKSGGLIFVVVRRDERPGSWHPTFKPCFSVLIKSCSCRKWVSPGSRGEPDPAAHVLTCTAPRAFPAEVLEL